MIDNLKDVIKFWFGTEKDGPDVSPQAFWFKSTPKLDDEIRSKFEKIYDQARAGQYDNKIITPNEHLAVIILLDQFPRNMFRNTPRAFATDGLAKFWTRKAIENGVDMMQTSIHRQCFFYLPLEHSEDLNDQNECVNLFENMGYDNYTRYAIAHRDVIIKFGRFPHRNKILGRESTTEEMLYLSKPGAGF